MRRHHRGAAGSSRERPVRSARTDCTPAWNLDRRASLIPGRSWRFLNRRDRWHEVCLKTFTTLTLPLATSAAVLTEVFHLLPGSWDLPRVWTFLRFGAVTVLPITDDDLPAIEALMDRYQDCPMDFADATLVHLARREALTTIFTIDPQEIGARGFCGDRCAEIGARGFKRVSMRVRRQSRCQPGARRRA